ALFFTLVGRHGDCVDGNCRIPPARPWRNAVLPGGLPRSEIREDQATRYRNRLGALEDLFDLDGPAVCRPALGRDELFRRDLPYLRDAGHRWVLYSKRQRGGF